MRNYNEIMFASKIIHNLLPFKPENFGFKLSHRSMGPLFIQETIRLKRAPNFARFSIPAEWNALPIKIRNTVASASLNNYSSIGC